MTYYFETNTWPWWFDTFRKVHSEVDFSEAETSLIFILNTFEYTFPKPYQEFIVGLLQDTNSPPRAFVNLPWSLTERIINTALTDNKNKFSELITAIIKLASSKLGFKILPELATQQYLYRILRSPSLVNLGYYELVNLLLIELAKQFTTPLWRLYSTLLKNYNQLELSRPLSKGEIDVILTYSKEIEEQFIQNKENKKNREDVLNFGEMADEFITDQFEEELLKFINGEIVNLSIFPTSYSLRYFIKERITISNLFFVRLTEIVNEKKHQSPP